MLRRNGSEELRAYLIEAHDGLVRHVVKEYMNSGESFDDLMQVGRLGLINAIDRFDPARGTQFATFAVPTIRGEIRRYFRDKGWHIKVPRRLQELVMQTKRAIEELTSLKGRSPTYPELARALNVPEHDVIEAVELSQQYEPAPIDGLTSDDDDAGDGYSQDRTGGLDQSLESLGERAELDAAIDRLPERERLIIRLRFFGELSQTEIAQRLGISQMHVSRLQHRALARLRRMLQDDREE
ncbi:MAG: SigB/SigF/SigG family RNA polymerase sigma factor [Armatimonadota bacterium]